MFAQDLFDDLAQGKSYIKDLTTTPGTFVESFRWQILEGSYEGLHSTAESCVDDTQ